jgi:hypothetical protein
MSAGLPGLGLGGLFFIFSALLAPFPELWRTLHGRSDLASWKAIGRQLVQALTMVAAIDLTLRLTYVVLSAAGVGDPPAADEATVLPLSLIGITTGLLVLVLCGAKLADLALRAPGGALPRVPEALPRVSPLRASGLGAVAVLAWIALLVVGASELSPLERPQRRQSVLRPERDAAAPPQATVEPRLRGRGGASSPPTTVETTTGVRNGAAGTPGSPPTPGDGAGGEAVAPAPGVAAPGATPAAPPAPAPTNDPEPQGPPVGTPGAGTSPAAGGKPESTGPPAGVPASEAPAPAPAAEPPPQAPAKGLRESE